MGKVATSPLPYRGAPPLQSGGQNQKWPTSGQIGYLTPAVSGSPTALERGAKSTVADKWAKWRPHPCRIGVPHRFRAGGKIRSGPQGGKVATSPLPYRGAPPLQSGGQNQKWPTSGQSGYLTPAVSGSPTAAERGAKSEVAHKWANWLPHPCRIGEPHRFRAGGKIRSGPQVGEMATSPLPYRTVCEHLPRSAVPCRLWDGESTLGVPKGKGCTNASEGWYGLFPPRVATTSDPAALPLIFPSSRARRSAIRRCRPPFPACLSAIRRSSPLPPYSMPVLHASPLRLLGSQRSGGALTHPPEPRDY